MRALLHARPLGLVLAGTFAAYTVVHFVYSGVIVALQSPNIRQIAYEIRPLNLFLATGNPVVLDESDQYGPVFFFVMHPVLRACGGNAWPLSRCVYGVQLVALAASFIFSWLTLRHWLAHRSPRLRLSGTTLAGLLLLLWFNFSPLYYIVATKSVEMWELALVTGGLYAYQRGRRGLAGVSVAAATFIKLLPGVFLVWFLLRDRKAFAWALVATAIILAVSQAIYGPAMGFGYPLHIAQAAVRPAADAATGLHANLAMKNLVVKAFGDLPTPRPEQVGDGRTGYVVTISRERLAVSNSLGVLLHVAALVAFVALLRPRDRTPPRGRREWEWALCFIAMIVLAPAATFEYMLLTLPAFAFVLTVLIVEPGARRPGTLWLFGVALLLVANVIPRSIVNEITGMRLLREMAGYSHLTLSETYQYFGIPLFGLFLLTAALWRVRSHVSTPP